MVTTETILQTNLDSQKCFTRISYRQVINLIILPRLFLTRRQTGYRIKIYVKRTTKRIYYREL